MTAEQAKDKARLLIIDPDFMTTLLKKVDQYIDSGIIDLEARDNDYFVPKIVLSAALENLADQYAPFAIEGKAFVKKLRAF